MLLLILTLALSLSSEAWAVTKYVTKSGTCTNGATNYSAASDTCGGGSSTVYTSIRSGADNVGASNTLQIRAGSYTELCVNGLIEGGTSVTPTLIEPYSGAAVTWTKTTGDSRDCLVSFTSPYVTINGKNSDGTGSLILDGANSNVSADQAILTAGNTTNLTIKNIELRNSAESCMVSIGSNSLIENNYIHDCGTVNSYLWHGIYYAGTGTIIRNNTFANIAGYGIHCYSGSSDCTSSQILNNKLFSVGTASDAQSGGILSDGPDNIIRYNIVRCTGTSTDFGIHLYPNATRNLVDHNSVTNCGTGINMAATTTNHSVRNNIFYSNGTNVNNSSTGSTLTTNQTTNPTWTNATTADLTLASGSTAINTCTNIGLSFNGAAPDCGAFETFTGTGGTVTGNTLDAQLGMSSRTPLVPGTTGFTVNNGRAVTGVALVGSSIARLTFDGAVCTGVQSWTWSYSGGTATDTAAIGSSLSGQLNQPLLTVGATSVTNNCSGASYSFTQAAFRHHGIYSASEAAPSIRSAENLSSFPVIVNGAVRVRFALVCDVGVACPSSSFSIRYAQGGGYSAVPNTPGAGNVSFCGTTYTGTGTLPNATPTTNQLSTSGTFVPGAVVYTNDAVPTVTLGSGNKTEIEYCVKFTNAATGTYTFRVYLQDGTALGTYTNTPSVTVIPPQANGGS